MKSNKALLFLAFAVALFIPRCALASTNNPYFGAGTGTYHGPVSVTINDSTSGATIRYTTDGSTPTASSTLYTGPVTISTNSVLSAIAFSGSTSSSVVSAIYTFTPSMNPIFSRGATNFLAPFTVSMADGTTGAVIHYTTNGTTPTVSSATYSAAITITGTTLVQAVAAVPGGPVSGVSSVTYTIVPAVTPSLSSGTGNYHAPPTISISDATSGAVIYYTTNGTTPTTASTVYSAPITLTVTGTLEAVAVYPGGPASAAASATYTIIPAQAPTFSTGSGTYHAPISVSISDATSGAVIHYTTDGTTPTAASAVYSGPVAIGSTSTLQAIAVYPGAPASPVGSASYTIATAVKPFFSAGAGTYHAPVSVTIGDGTAGAVIHYTTDGSTPTAASPTYSGTILISSTTTLQATAIYPGGQPGPVDSATFTITPAMTPLIRTQTGTFHAPITASIADGTVGAVIYYTTNGTTPSTASAVYSTPVAINATTTLQAIAVYPGGPASGVTSATYSIVPPLTPVLSQATGNYERTMSVGLSDGTPGATIYYTTNGTQPTTSSTAYSAPISFSNSATFSSAYTLKAIAAVPGGPSTPVVSATYTLLSADTPIHGVNSGASFFGMHASGLSNGTPWPVVPVSALRVFDTDTVWSALNPASGTYQWSHLDAEIKIAQENDAQILFTFSGTPPWAIPTDIGVSSIVRSGNVVTVTTTQAHGLYYNPTYGVPDQTSIAVSGVADASFDGTFSLTGTPTPTSLTYAQTGANSTSSAGKFSAVCAGVMAPAACAEPPVSLASWNQFVTALVDHVGPGVIQYWELWNEANIAETWRGDPKLLVTMAANAKSIIKGVDPKAILLSPSTTVSLETPSECATYDPRCGSNWTSKWLAAGGKNSVDVIAFHGYPWINELPEQIQGAVTLEQIAMNQNGVGSLPLWDTESSWGTNASLPAENDQVNFLARHLLLEESMGVQRQFWWDYDGGAWGTLWTSAVGLNPAGDAYQQVEKWVTGTTLSQPCAPTDAGSTTYTCGYTRANGYKALAVWSTSTAKPLFTVPTGYVQYHDLGGNEKPISGWGSLDLRKSDPAREQKRVLRTYSKSGSMRRGLCHGASASPFAGPIYAYRNSALNP